MTKAPTIIDGVDVIGCKNFSCGVCEEENKIPRTINHFTADCRMYPNCYYKQQKRKEQDYEKLRKYHNKCCEENAKKETEWLEVQNRSLFLALTVSNVAVERVPDTHKIKIHGKGDLSFPESNVVSLTTLLFPSLAY